MVDGRLGSLDGGLRIAGDALSLTPTGDASTSFPHFSMANLISYWVNDEQCVVDTDEGLIFPAADPSQRIQLPRLSPQRNPFGHPDSKHHFRAEAPHSFEITTGARELYGELIIFGCLNMLHAWAIEQDGLDGRQVFQDDSKLEPLWIIEDGDGGTVTALLPSESGLGTRETA